MSFIIEFQAAIRDNDPVVFLENELLYGVAFDMSSEAMSKDFVVPIGKVRITKKEATLKIVQALFDQVRFILLTISLSRVLHGNLHSGKEILSDSFKGLIYIENLKFRLIKVYCASVDLNVI